MLEKPDRLAVGGGCCHPSEFYMELLIEMEDRMGEKQRYDGITSVLDPSSTGGAEALPAAVRAYVHAALAPRTRQAYREDLARFLAWGGRIPCGPEMVAA